MSSGLITLNNGENVVSGEGTAFSHDLISGDFICARAGGILYTLAILSVDSDTEITLVKPYEGPDETGLAWYAVPRRLQNQITAELVAQNTEALRRSNANDANFQRLLTENGYVTITMQNGGEFSGPTWPKIIEIVETADIARLEQLAEQINTDTAQVAADKTATEASAAAAKQAAGDGAQYAAAAQQYATQAGESVTEAGQQVTLANEAANRAQEQAAVSQSSAEKAATDAGRAEQAADRVAQGLPDASVIWEVLGVPTATRAALKKSVIDPADFNAMPAAVENSQNLNTLFIPGTYYPFAFGTVSGGYPENFIYGYVKVVNAGNRTIIQTIESHDGRIFMRAGKTDNTGVEYTFDAWNVITGSALRVQNMSAEAAAVFTSKTTLMASAEAEIAPLARAVKFDMATQEEVVRLEALERYTVLLNRVDCTNPEWPELP